MHNPDITIEPSKSSQPTPGLSILIADDDERVLKLVERTVSRLGHEITGVFSNGKALLEQVRKQRPDLIILDVDMPEMNGLETARRVRELCDTPIIISTGHSDEGTVTRALAIGIGGYLVKPYSPAQLGSTIQCAIFQSAPATTPSLG